MMKSVTPTKLHPWKSVNVFMSKFAIPTLHATLYSLRTKEPFTTQDRQDYFITSIENTVKDFKTNDYHSHNLLTSLNDRITTKVDPDEAY